VSNILDIHITRTAAGTLIPFDKLYLVKPEDTELISKIFGYGIVLPFTTELQETLYTLKPASITRKHFRRNDQDKAVPAEINGKDLIEGRFPPAAIRNWWVEFGEEFELSKRLVVIPVLTSIARRKIRPRYLANQKWFMPHTQQTVKRKLTVVGSKEIAPALSDYAYLATPLKAPQDKIRPLCTICPRLMRHVQGECVPGQLICYASLNFADIAGDGNSASVQSNND